MNNIGNKIRKTREEKGITQEYMALELDVAQSNYGRLEKDDNRITIPKLLKIAELLDVSISYLFSEKAGNIIHHNRGDNAQASINAIYSDKEHIKSLKEEIQFLREIMDKNRAGL